MNNGSAVVKLAFGYKCGAGKDTAVLAARRGLESKGFKVYEFRFASALYGLLHHCQKVCGFPFEKDRAFLHWVGTDWARSKDPQVWVKCFANKVDTRLAKYEDPDGGLMPGTRVALLCPDLRFQNEFQYLRQTGWTAVKVDRPLSAEQLAARLGTGADGHVSETQLDAKPDWDWDCVIKNDGSLAQFDASVQELVEYATANTSAA